MSFIVKTEHDVSQRVSEIERKLYLEDRDRNGVEGETEYVRNLNYNARAFAVYLNEMEQKGLHFVSIAPRGYIFWLSERTAEKK